jgi:hypothetical protein
MTSTIVASIGTLERDLARAVDGEVRFDEGTRGAYSTDGSNFRQVPIGVVLPRTVDAAVAAVAVCRSHGVPVVAGGAGVPERGPRGGVPRILPFKAIALEGLDHRLLDDEQIEHMNSRALAELPRGSAFLMVQFGGDSRAEVDNSAQAMLDGLRETEHEPQVSFYDDPALEDELRAVREAGLGVLSPGNRRRTAPRPAAPGRQGRRPGRRGRRGRHAGGRRRVERTPLPLTSRRRPASLAASRSCPGRPLRRAARRRRTGPSGEATPRRNRWPSVPRRARAGTASSPGS